MNPKRLVQPWTGASALSSSPRRITVKFALGEAPETIPALRDVRLGVHRPAERTGVGPVDRLISRFAEDVRLTRVHASRASAGRPGEGGRGYDGLEHATGLSRTFRLTASRPADVAHLVESLRGLVEVEEASPEYVCGVPFSTATLAALDPVATSDDAWWPREQVNAPAALAYTRGDPSVIVAIVDTGVVATGGDFSTRLRAGVDTVELGAGDVAPGIRLVGDFRDADRDPSDDCGHGTQCAGIIGATGAALPPGLGGECAILPIRVLCGAQLPGRTERIGVGQISDIDRGLKAAIDLGATVVNMSFGTPLGGLVAGDPVPHADVVSYALARGCVLVAASGNTGKTEQFTPAALDGVLAVGSVGSDGTASSFSTRGDHVALCAPGERVVTSALDGYTKVTGTSFAAPFVAAAAALLVSRARERAVAVDAPTVRRLLAESAAPWSGPAPEGCGSGVLDAHAALRALDREIDSGQAGVL